MSRLKVPALAGPARLLRSLGLATCCAAMMQQGIAHEYGVEPAAEARADAAASSAPQTADSLPAEIVIPPEPADAAWSGPDRWDWQILPGSLIYQSYLAGAKEPRFASFWSHDKNEGWIWDIALGGRVGILRYGTLGRERPDGWQLDMEGAAFPRLDLEDENDLVSVDFRFGVPVTYGAGPYRGKLAFYHISSHAGDEFLETHPSFTRINYSRNVLVWGNSVYCNDATRLYVEVGWAFESDVADPWEYQAGIDYSPLASRSTGAPFAAVNGHVREELSFGGNLVVQAGWQWRQGHEGRVFRAGVEYYDGLSDQFEFYRRYEQKIGLGLWYDY